MNYLLSHIHMHKKQIIIIPLRPFTLSENIIHPLSITVGWSNYSDSTSIKEPHIPLRTKHGQLCECSISMNFNTMCSKFEPVCSRASMRAS